MMSTPEENKNETAQAAESAAEKPVEKTDAAASEAAAEPAPEKDWHEYIPKLLTVSPSPHLRTEDTTRSIMLDVESTSSDSAR